MKNWQIIGQIGGQSAIALCLCVGPACSQTPEFVPPTVPLPPEATPLPPLEEVLGEPSPPPAAPLPSVPGTVTVSQFTLVGHTAFSTAELEALLQPFTHVPLTFTELLQAAETITAHYHQAGYITSGAIVPPQSIEPGGVVQIEVIEGAIEAIEITGLQRLKPAYVRDRVQRAVQVPLAPAQLVEGLQLLQLDPLIATLNVNLTAGSRLGSSILEIEILEASPVSAALAWNNARSPSVGTEQTVGTITHRNLLGYGDRLSVALGRTAGSTTLENLSYVWPLNARGDELSVRHQRSHNEIIEAPFDQLAITSRSRRTEVGYRQLLVKTPKREWAIGAIATWQTSQTFLGLGDIGGFPLTPGADEEGRTAIAALRLFTEFSARSASAAWALRSQLSIGFAGEQQPGQPNSRFVTLRTQAQYLRRLGSRGLFLLRTDWQWTPDDLLSLEEFSLGGATTVRGYRQGERVGDNGLWVSAEIRWPIAQIPEWSAQLEVVPFLDWGWVWDVDSTAAPTEMNEFLAALGMGFALRLGQNFQAQLDWGVPLVERSRPGSSWQENGFHLQLNYGF